MRLIRTVLGRLARDERVRFLAVGAVNTVTGYGLFVLFESVAFSSVRYGYLISLALSYAIAIVIAFILYRRFVFRVSGNVLVDFMRFVGVYAVSIGINFVALPLLVELVGITPMAAQAAVLVTTTLVSFFGHKYFSFRRGRAQSTSAT